MFNIKFTLKELYNLPTDQLELVIKKLDDKEKDYLLGSYSVNIRVFIARYGNSKQREILATDKNPIVRAEVARSGECLDILINDPVFVVKQAARRELEKQRKE